MKSDLSRKSPALIRAVAAVALAAVSLCLIGFAPPAFLSGGTSLGRPAAPAAAPILLAAVAFGDPGRICLGSRCRNATHPNRDVGDASGPGRTQGETLLVVDDASHLCQAISAGLRSFGYNVVTAADGREALDTASVYQVDLVLTDIVMPRMGGQELLCQLRADHPHVRVVAMTGHVVDTQMEELRAAGFDDALPKPFSIDELAERLRAVLDA